MPSVMHKLKDARSCDIHLFLQAFLYLLAIVAGGVVLGALSMERSYFGGYCMLYAEVTKNDADAQYQYFIHLRRQGECHYALTMEGVAAFGYSLAMAIYFFYSFHRSRTDFQKGSQMWVIPFLFTNCLVLFLVFVAACIISVGFKQFCDQQVATPYLERCSDLSKRPFKIHFYRNGKPDSEYDISPSYRLMTVAEIAAWVTVIVWVLQCILTAIRLCRNKRQTEDTQDIVPSGVQPGA